MSREPLPEELLRLVTPQQARTYAIAKGWQKVAGVNGSITLFALPGAGYEQLIIPTDVRFDDYTRRIADIVVNLAEVENRTESEVLQDLLQPDADILRYTVAAGCTTSGTMPLAESLRLLDGARRSLLAASCSVVSPSRFHPRLSRSEATQLVDACRLGQTERGSFTISISCPLRAVEEDQTFVSGNESFTRRATSLLMRSMHCLVEAIESDRVRELVDKTTDQPILSANLCDAILRMRPPEERSSLSVAIDWAATAPPADRQRTFERVTVYSEYFPIIEDVYRMLRPPEQPVASLFVGQVDALNGTPGSDGAVQGETTLLVLRDEELIRVRADLNARDYQTAVDAHREAGFVSCKGVLRPGRRIHRLTDISGFVRLQK